MPITLSGSLSLTGSVVASGNLTTTGTITAQTLVVQTITSSINYITGSSDFGSLQSNRHTFTGSLYITGSTSTFSGCVGIGTSPSYQLDMSGGTTVNQRIRLQRGSDDSNQNMLLGWNNVVLTRSNVSIAGNQTDFSIIQCGSDGARTPFYVSVGGQSCFICSVWIGSSGCCTQFGQDPSGGYIEHFGNTATKSVYRIQSSKSGDNTNYSQLVVDPYCGFLFKSLNGGNGCVGIGTSSPAYMLDVAGAGRFQGNLAAGAGLPANTYPLNLSSGAGTQMLANSTRTGGGGIILQNNGSDRTYIGTANWTGLTGYDNTTTDMAISNAQNSALVFAVNAANVSTGEKMRISCNGFTHFGNAGSYVNGINTAYHTFDSDSSGNSVLYFYHRSATGNGLFTNVQACNTTYYTFQGYSDPYGSMAFIYSNGTFGSRTNVYSTIVSDVRCKTEIVDASSQWSDIKNLRVRNFKLIEDVEKDPTNALRQIGFIAQEVECVSPNLVFESGDGCVGTEPWKNVKSSIIHIKAVKALQEAMCRIEILESCLGMQ